MRTCTNPGRSCGDADIEQCGPRGESADRRHPPAIQRGRRSDRPQSRCRAGGQARVHRRPGHLQLRRRRPACCPVRQRVAQPRRRHRAADPAVPARHHRLSQRVPRGNPGRRRARCGQHAADPGRLRVHAGRQPGADRRRVGTRCCPVPPAGPEAAFPAPDPGLGRSGRRTRFARSPRWRGLRRPSRRRRRPATIPVSGSIRPGPRARPRAPSTSTRTSSRPPNSTREPGARHRRARCRLFGGQALLRLRARQRADLPAGGRARPRC